ncbi:XapX domain-containing protein [Roseomonas eburnea]|uniref:XapX domain-containing protein n=1 Tax=Neoroseomonas eburnea TaxID=1346889 RepID=A0A9X9XDU4_9PROT|nr:XapX domain-containing protein [Neoroseomonas eburnea]MBR0681880.1 XapX domain-containing protein [Neoroseomonas eburnea]
MKAYLLALGAGVLVGVIYGLLQVRSPAPPVIALVGLLGMLVGEQVVPLARRVIEGQGITLGLLRQECGEHVLGRLPERSRAEAPSPPA